MPAERNLRAATDRIEVLLGDVASLGDPQLRAKAEELVSLLMEMYGSGLARLMEIVDEAGGSAADEVFARLGADKQVSGILLLHGLHPVELETRVERALDSVRPYLGSHGGDVKLVGIERGVVRLRLEGSCNGCSGSTVTMKLAVEEAIEEAAPDIAGIEVEGMPPQPPPASPLVTLGSGDRSGN
jgi:Fe-S cluster biogenesis protein NfuA